MRSAVSLAAAIQVLALSSYAHGETPAPQRLRRVMLGVEVGFGTPVGEAGVFGEFRIFPALSVGAGVGQSIPAPTLAEGTIGRVGHTYGVFTALHPFGDMVTPNGRVAPTLRFAYSVGPFSEVMAYDGEYGEYVTEQVSPHAKFVQVDGGGEFHAEDGLFLRVLVGIALLSNPAELHCYHHVGSTPVDPPCVADSPLVIPTLSIAGGYSF